MKRRAPGMALLAALAPLAAAPAAEAGTIIANLGGAGNVLVNQSEFVDGTSAESMMLALPSAGELSLSLTDMQFTGALISLEFGLSETGSSLTGMMAADAMTIDFTRATTLYVNVFAQAGTATGFGLYNINAEFEPTVGPNATAVRLPASAPLLSAGLAALFWTFRRRPQAIVTGTVP